MSGSLLFFPCICCEGDDSFFVVNMDMFIGQMLSADIQLEALGVDYERYLAVVGSEVIGRARRRVVGFIWCCAIGRK